MEADPYKSMKITKSILDLNFAYPLTYAEGAAVKCLLEITEENIVEKITEAMWFLQKKLERIFDERYERVEKSTNNLGRDLHKYANKPKLDKKVFEDPEYEDETEDEHYAYVGKVISKDPVDWIVLEQKKPHHCQSVLFSLSKRDASRAYSKVYYGMYLKLEFPTWKINSQGKFGVFFDGKNHFFEDRIDLWKTCEESSVDG